MTMNIPSSMFVSASSLSLLDTFWILFCAILVIFMTIPGLALFYGGLVRRKNVISVLMKSFTICAVITVLWQLIGYSLAFSEFNPFIGGIGKAFFQLFSTETAQGMITVNQDYPSIPESVFVIYSMAFAILAPALITGGFAERMKFSSCIVFSILWSLVVYSPIAHMVWDKHGWLATSGVLDFAGGTVVHITSGVAGLVAAIILGKRNVIKDQGNAVVLPYNLVFSFIGAAILWVGWFGFNGGSTYAFNQQAILAIINTQTAAAVGVCAWLLIESLHGKPSAIGAASGAIAGLVAITPAAGYVLPVHAVIMGAVAGISCYYACGIVKKYFGYDDALDAFGIHGVGGIIGGILTGVFARKSLAGIEPSVFMQLKGIIFTIIYTAIVTTILLKLIEKIMGLRVDPQTENIGLDIEQHGSEIRV